MNKRLAEMNTSKKRHTHTKHTRISNTHMWVEGEVQVFPELACGGATPVLKHMQVGLTFELQKQEQTQNRDSQSL